jgi:hypothetical protein
MAVLSASVGRGGANKPADVFTVQSLLNQHIRNLGLASLETDSRIGNKTITAIEAFQRTIVGLSTPDGRIDPNGSTLRALNHEPLSNKGAGSAGASVGKGAGAGAGASGGASVGKPVTGAVRSAAWPPKPSLRPMGGNNDRARVFGRFQYVHAPLKDNKENIKILGDWVQKNITTVKLNMGPHVGVKTVEFHKLAAAQLQRLWKAWDDAGLLDRVLSYSGSFVPRFSRDSTTNLSNHSFGSAFDINVPWNGFKARPALLGDKGCVRELVPIANELGFYWGGHFSRLDGMHFEVAKLM